MKRVLLPRFDSLGDIILIEGLLEAALHASPGLDLTLLVRRGMEQLRSLMPPGLKWISLDLNPYTERPSPVRLEAILDLPAQEWDEIWWTAFNKTWADTFLSFQWAQIPQYHLGAVPEPDAALQQQMKDLGLLQSRSAAKAVPVRAESHELEKIEHFGRTRGVVAGRLEKPRLSIRPPVLGWAKDFLQQRGFREREYVVCLPGGVANVSCKLWPPGHYAQVISWLESAHGVRALLAGDEREAAIVQQVYEQSLSLGASAESWIGKAGELECLAALIHFARFYFGADSGPMHLACALNVPAAVLFGGGHWPRFLPFGRASVAVREMPCFGCGWNCCFGDAPCIRELPLETVQEAVQALLQAETPDLQIFHAPGHSPETQRFIARAAELHRNLERTRASQLADLEALWLASERDRAARLEVIESQGIRIARMDAEIAWLNRKIQELQADLQVPGEGRS